jgi:hypothetical protein
LRRQKFIFITETRILAGRLLNPEALLFGEANLRVKALYLKIGIIVSKTALILSAKPIDSPQMAPTKNRTTTAIIIPNIIFLRKSVFVSPPITYNFDLILIGPGHFPA